MHTSWFVTDFHRWHLYIYNLNWSIGFKVVSRNKFTGEYTVTIRTLYHVDDVYDSPKLNYDNSQNNLSEKQNKTNNRTESIFPHGDEQYLTAVCVCVCVHLCSTGAVNVNYLQNFIDCFFHSV